MFIPYITLLLSVQYSLQNVINSEPTAVHTTIPYHVGLLSLLSNDTVLFCSGSLITTKFVLTAAHCLEDATSITVDLGTNSISVLDNNSDEIVCEKFKIHEQYEPTTSLNDIGIIELSKHVTLTQSIDTVQLPTESDDVESIIDQYIKLSGWGFTTGLYSFESDVLKELSIRIVNDAECADLNVDSTKICGYSEINGSACIEDMGSPLVLDNIQIGLVSRSSKARCTEGNVHVYTKVSSYLDWIRQNSDYEISEE